jgi:hypothetical protein
MKWIVEGNEGTRIAHLFNNKQKRNNEMVKLFLDVVQSNDTNNFDLIMRVTNRTKLDSFVEKMVSQCYARNMVLEKVTENYNDIYGKIEKKDRWGYTVSQMTDDDGDIVTYHFRFRCNSKQCHIQMTYDSYDDY